MSGRIGSLTSSVRTPASKGANRLENLKHLRAGDELKFVIASRGDYEWARAFLSEHPVCLEVPVHFSPVHDQIELLALAQWVLEDGLAVRVQMQLHKLLWGAETRGV